MKIILSIDETNLSVAAVEVTDVQLPEKTGSLHTLYCNTEEEKKCFAHQSVQDMVNIYCGWHLANKNVKK